MDEVVDELAGVKSFRDKSIARRPGGMGIGCARLRLGCLGDGVKGILDRGGEGGGGGTSAGNE